MTNALNSDSLQATNSHQSTINIKPLMAADQPHWRRLWDAYLNFYNTDLPEATIANTWQNLIHNDVPIYGFGAYLDGVLVGITHIVIHPNTWNVTDCCYLEDLYVDNRVRGQGVGRALIQHVYDFASSQQCNRVYWTTQEDNTAARQLYDTLAHKTDMVQYRHNLYRHNL